MKRVAVFLCVMALFLSFSIWAANPPADFSGTWQQDTKLSDAAPKSTGGGGMGGGMMGGMGGMGGGMGGPGMMGGMGGPGGGMGRGGQQANKTLVIQQTPQEITITNKGANNGKDIVEVFKLDGIVIKEMVQVAGMWGQPATQAKQETKVKLSGSKFEVTQKVKSNTPTSLKKTYSLSKDGKVLTLKVVNNQQYGGTQQKLVYNKE